MTLEDIVESFKGKPVYLSGVGRESIDGIVPSIGYDGGNAEVFSFILNERLFVAREDPDDGYRSCMRDIREVSVPPDYKKFAEGKVRVRLEMQETDHSEIMDVLDAGTRDKIIEVGTCRTDDYYPSFVNSFRPENALSVEPWPEIVREPVEEIGTEDYADWGTFG